MNTFMIEKGYFRVAFNNTVEDLYVDKHRDFDHLFEPIVWYEHGKARGLSEGAIIDNMLKMLHKRRVFDGGNLAELDLCIALLGPRGAGKSCGMVGMAILDGLLAGRRVISNLPIAVRVRYKDCQKVFRTENLDAALMLDENEFNDNYYDCLICVDEVNTYIADSQRTMTNQALTFGNILQQMRHRHLSFIFTTQAEGWNTNRVRFQTDFYIQCRDVATLEGTPKKGRRGRHSHWKIHDMSGLQTGEVLKDDTRTNAVPAFTEKEFWNTWTWKCFDSGLMQRRDKFVKGKRNGEGELDQEAVKREIERLQQPSGLIKILQSNNMRRLSRANTWAMLGCEGNRSEQTKQGKALLDLGSRSIEIDGERGYEFPTPAALKKQLDKRKIQLEAE